jgi:hypothetical protein
MKNLQFSEERDTENDYHICLTCETPTVLLTTGCIQWSPDEEPYKSGELLEEIQDQRLKKFAQELDEGVELGEEISIHFCPQCKKITSICVNWN